MNKKVLIISYYWPPSGGAGVQRWLKLSKYLIDLNIEVHVLAPKAEQASYITTDESLFKDVHPEVQVHRTDSFEVINYYSRLVGKKNVPTAGFSNVDNSNIKQKVVNALRSNLFIPDPRIGWKKYAVKKGLELIKKFDIKTVITTSPPHSTQIIGRDLKRKANINWIVDFRDPWTDIYYYSLLGHSSLSAKKDKALEKAVIEECDHIITVSYGFREIFKSKSSSIRNDKFSIIPNGFDDKDFSTQTKTNVDAEKFLICYTGTISNQYDPISFFEAVEEANKSTSMPIIFKCVGIIAQEIKEKLKGYSFESEFVDLVPHNKIHHHQLNCDLLLLVIPDIEKAKGITPGKLFEYLATKNQIIAIGPKDSDVNRIISECEAGITCERDMKKKMVEFISSQINKKLTNNQPQINIDTLEKYSRKNQAKSIGKLI